MNFDKELRCCIDSRGLYGELKGFGLNVTDLGDKVFVYGEIDAKDFDKIIRICTKYAEIED